MDEANKWNISADLSAPTRFSVSNALLPYNAVIPLSNNTRNIA